MSQEQTSFFDGETKKKVKSKKHGKSTAEFFMPFSIGSLSRSLAACRLTAFARGDESDDLQARVTGHLVAFREKVPSWALRMSEFEGAPPILVAVALDKGSFEDSGQYLAVEPVLPTSAIRYIGFSSEEHEQNFISRIKRFPDVPMSLFETRVVESAFWDCDEAPPESLAASLGVHEDIANRRVLSQVGGIVACLKDSLHVHNDSDEFVSSALFLVGDKKRLSEALYEASSLYSEASSLDRSIWVAAFEKVSAVSAKEGIDVFRFIDELVDALRKSGGPDDQAGIEKWASFSRAVLEGERDIPENFSDSANNAQRAVLIFLLAKGYNGLREIMKRVTVGPRVRTLALALCGLFDQVDRLPRTLKGEVREELDCLSQIIIDIDGRKPIKLEVSHSAWSENFTIRDRILRDGMLFTERSFQPEADLVELFAKARRLNLSAQYDATSQCFYFPLEEEGTGKKKGGVNLFIQIMKSTTTSRQIRLYIPLMKMTARAPAKKKYESLLRQAWENGIGVGAARINGAQHVALFSIQLIDTFDHEEFSGLMTRFRSMLCTVRGVAPSVPLSEARGECVADAINDLIPVCPNCHAMMYRTRRALKIHQLRNYL